MQFPIINKNNRLQEDAKVIIKRSIVLIMKIINHLTKIMLILIFTLLCSINYAYAADGEDSLVSRRLEEKISKRFTNKFCNSVGFGLSKDSALKFAIGENNVELSGQKNTAEVNIRVIEDKTAESIIEKCGYNLNQLGQTGIEEFKKYLKDNEAFTYLENTSK